jgi:hypothetical protein
MGISARVPAPQDELSPYINGAPATPFLAQKPSSHFLHNPPPMSCRLEACRAKTNTEGGSPSSLHPCRRPLHVLITAAHHLAYGHD